MPYASSAPPHGGIAGYEFAPHEDAVLARTGGRASVWGVLSIALGGLLLVVGMVAAILGGTRGLIAAGGLVVAALKPLITGGFYISAGRSLSAVAETQGSDIPHTIAGLAKLRNAFRFDAIVSAILMVAGFLWGFVVAFMSHSP